MKGQSLPVLCGILAYFVGGQVYAEPLDLPPREAEVLAVMPRVTSSVPASDPVWLFRGAIRPEGVFDTPSSASNTSINRRQIDLLRTLDKLRWFKPEDEPDLGSIADKLGKPEVIPIAPRTVK